ncbi:MAG: diguanylate cyclase [Proteobacteria bacterium]|nr:diguanylate cyclase [Pseudomonadota bacterium]
MISTATIADKGLDGFKLLDSLGDLAFVTDNFGEVQWLNGAARAFFGQTDKDIVGTSVSRLFSGKWAQLVAFWLTQQVESHSLLAMKLAGLEECWRVDLTKSEIEGNRLLVVARDVTRAWLRKSELERAALHDSLTGLPNRDLFLDHLRRALARRKRGNGLVGLVFMDLNNFKRVNDYYGHVVGDTLLTEVAQRLRAGLRESDVVARFGGDEFVGLIEISEPEQGDEIVQRIHAKM